jgi:hypothetical protein
LKKLKLIPKETKLVTLVTQLVYSIQHDRSADKEMLEMFKVSLKKVLADKRSSLFCEAMIEKLSELHIIYDDEKEIFDNFQLIVEEVIEFLNKLEFNSPEAEDIYDNIVGGKRIPAISKLNLSERDKETILKIKKIVSSLNKLKYN